ncbi:hypothetical protein E2K80_01745 [Rhodophyticola sp. CCM32]|uniref:hypothetical protein n=1 Tax=Rhodophyticola sp. CCM32 TaxID=2916397 RepID=UPI00107F82F4|nr:hypothetical protein [Rhodophyticola sp. CCM32]QBX99600.1 hypothetical protein E2K80_01745 [Rhodophyticola sp. CCM32]
MSIVSRTDAMVECALELLLHDAGPKMDVVKILVNRWPEATGLQLMVALIGAANAIEQVYAVGSPARLDADRAIRRAVLLSLDLYALESRGISPARGRDLLAFWGEEASEAGSDSP